MSSSHQNLSSREININSYTDLILCIHFFHVIILFNCQFQCVKFVSIFCLQNLMHVFLELRFGASISVRPHFYVVWEIDDNNYCTLFGRGDRLISVLRYHSVMSDRYGNYKKQISTQIHFFLYVAKLKRCFCKLYSDLNSRVF